MSHDNHLILPPEDSRVELARARLRLARQHTQLAVTALRSEVTVQTDWRAWVRADPGVYLAAAFFFGLFLAKHR
jgi:hypothetical protein